MQDLGQNLIQITGDLKYILPESILAITLLLVLLIDLIFLPNKHILLAITCFGILISTYFSIIQYHEISVMTEVFNGMLRIDSSSVFFKIILSISSIIVVLMTINSSIKKPSEYFILLLTILLGANFLIMSKNLLMTYFSLEVISIPSYIFTIFSFDKRSAEAGLKYFLFGAAASGVMLYGMSLLFIMTGTLDFTSQMFIDSLLGVNHLPLIVSSIFILTGFLFKIAAAPLHIWSPDVYTSAPTPAVAFFSIVPKIAGLAVMIKIVLALNLFGQSPINWTTLLAVLTMITLLVGNFSALWQSNVKRMMAFSSIAQTGFLLVGIAAFSENGLSNMIFYAVIYSIANLGVFVLIQYFENKHKIENIKDYSGLVKHYPVLTITFLILLISLTGLPPTAGFTSKFLIFSTLWESYSVSENNWQLYLIIFGLLNTVVSLFYYLKIPYYMIFKPLNESIKPGQIKFGIENYLSVVMVLAVLILFFKPDWLMGLINNINFAF